MCIAHPSQRVMKKTRWEEVEEFMAMMTCKSCKKLNEFKDAVVRIEDEVRSARIWHENGAF